MVKNNFRGKRVDNGEWVFGYHFITPLTAEYNIDPKNGAYFDSGIDFRRNVIADWKGVVFEVNPETIGRSSDILDDNGYEIFDGDILGF
jgi:hypothetical protein